MFSTLASSGLSPTTGCPPFMPLHASGNHCQSQSSWAPYRRLSKLASFDRFVPSFATYSIMGIVTIGTALPDGLVRTKSSPLCPGVALASGML